MPVKMLAVLELKINGDIEPAGLGESLGRGVREKETQKSES